MEFAMLTMKIECKRNGEEERNKEGKQENRDFVFFSLK